MGEPLLEASRSPSRAHAAGLAHALALLVLLTSAAPARAQDVGTVIVADGVVEIGRAGTWSAAAPGSAVAAGDWLRTGTPGRLRIIFQDDSLLDLGPSAHVAIDEQVFDRTAGSARTMLRLLGGKVRALVSEYYKDRNAVYEIETATAVAGVRGTEFVITYDPVAELTEVVGVSGRVEVASVMDRVAGKVFVSAREATSVERGGFPSPPRRVDESKFRQYLEGVTLNRVPRPQNVASVQQTVTAGSSVPATERATVPASGAGGTEGPAPASPEGSKGTTETAVAEPAPQTIEVHTTPLQPTSPQTTGSTAGTMDTGQQTTTIQTTTAQTDRDRDRRTGSTGAEPEAAPAPAPASPASETGGTAPQAAPPAPAAAPGTQPAAVKPAAPAIPEDVAAAPSVPQAEPAARDVAPAPAVEQPAGTEPGADAQVAAVAAPDTKAGEAEKEESSTTESDEDDEESNEAENDETETAEASTSDSADSGSQATESAPAASSAGAAQPIAAVEPVPFLIGPGASATLPEPLNATGLVGAGPLSVTNGKLRIRIF